MNAQATSGARTRARELLLQALYQQQIAGDGHEELLSQFREQAAYARVDQDFFDDALREILAQQAMLHDVIESVVDRPIEQLDPVEHGILLIGVYELRVRIDVPYRVVINEGVKLARRFGAVDGHKYINACLDAAAKRLREKEMRG